MRTRSFALSALSIGCVILVASPSWAVVLEQGFGDLTINQGQGFNPVTPRTIAKVGDSVMVGPAGSATIVYDDGCKVPVRPGGVVTIAPLSPCASGSNAADLGLPPAAPAVIQPETAEGNPWVGVGVGLLAAGALGFGIWRATEHNGTTPPVTPACSNSAGATLASISCPASNQ